MLTSHYFVYLNFRIFSITATINNWLLFFLAKYLEIGGKLFSDEA
jgi:hypothetical protein